MPEKFTKYKLLISCPGDVEEDIKIIEKVIKKFNRTTGKKINVKINTVFWKKNSYAQLGNSPQEILNEQFVNDCDFMVAIFWTRFGTPTDKYGSGTEDEIYNLLGQKKQVFLYFSDRKINPEKIDNDQYTKLLDFKNKINKNGIYFTYKSSEELEKMFYKHLRSYFSKHLKQENENEEIIREKKDEIKENLINLSSFLLLIRKFFISFFTQLRKLKIYKYFFLSFIFIILLLILNSYIEVNNNGIKFGNYYESSNEKENFLTHTAPITGSLSEFQIKLTEYYNELLKKKATETPTITPQKVLTATEIKSTSTIPIKNEIYFDLIYYFKGNLDNGEICFLPLGDYYKYRIKNNGIKKSGFDGNTTCININEIDAEYNIEIILLNINNRILEKFNLSNIYLLNINDRNFCDFSQEKINSDCADIMIIGSTGYTEISGSFKNCDELNPYCVNYLLVSEGTLEDLEDIEKLKYLKGLSINNNLISDISTLKNLKYLEDIIILENKIEKIDSLIEMLSLETLVLDGNKIIKIPDFSYLNNIVTLSLKNMVPFDPRNQFCNIDFIKTLNQLKFLFLNENQCISNGEPIKMLENVLEIYYCNTSLNIINFGNNQQFAKGCPY